MVNLSVAAVDHGRTVFSLMASEQRTEPPALFAGGCSGGKEDRRRGATLGGVPTRYLIIGALVTALVILAGVGAWFLLGVL